MSRSGRSWRQWSLLLLLFLCAWTAVWLLLTAQLYMMVSATSSRPVYVEGIAYGQLIRVLIWMPVTFVVIWAFHAWPLAGPRALGAALRHIGLSIGLMFASHLLRLLVLGRGEEVGAARFWNTAVLAFNGVTVTDLVIYWGIIGVMALRAFSEREQDLEVGQERLRASLAEAELRALKYQLKPHFVFNSLNAISALIREEHHGKALDTLADLSVLMRTMSDAPAKERVLVVEEISFIERLLAIEQVRFGEKIRVAIEVAPGTENALIPSLLLQPLVENAIKHGISRRVRPGRVQVRVDLAGGGSRLRLTVTNDGPRPDAQPPRAGVGLTATTDRLRLLYGDDFSMQLDLEREDDASVVLDLPFQTATSDQQPSLSRP